MKGSEKRRNTSSQTPPSQPVEWKGRHQEVLETLIAELSSPPIIAYQDFEKPFVLHVKQKQLYLKHKTNRRKKLKAAILLREWHDLQIDEVKKMTKTQLVVRENLKSLIYKYLHEDMEKPNRITRAPIQSIKTTDPFEMISINYLHMENK